jgi:hypothetical protein
MSFVLKSIWKTDFPFLQDFPTRLLRTFNVQIRELTKEGYYMEFPQIYLNVEGVYYLSSLGIVTVQKFLWKTLVTLFIIFRTYALKIYWLLTFLRFMVLIQ